ncbi:MAG: type II toxin-antitoxin system VapC family toxin [Gemmataceae bacterium]
MLVQLDTGILLRLLERTDPHHADIRAAIKNLRAGGDEPVTSAQNIAEFWNVSTRPSTARGGYGLTVVDAEKRLKIVERLFRVLPDTPQSYAVWRRLIINHGVMGVQVHDARLVAWMLAQGISHIVTLNGSDFARYPGITALAPNQVQAPPPNVP